MIVCKRTAGGFVPLRARESCSRRKAEVRRVVCNLVGPDSESEKFPAVHLTYIYVWAIFLASPFTEGVFRRRSVGGAGRRRPQAGLVTSSPGAQSPAAPREGAAFNGWARSDEGRREA